MTATETAAATTTAAADEEDSEGWKVSPPPSERSDTNYLRDVAGSDIVDAARSWLERRRAMAVLTGTAAADEEKGLAAAAAAKGESRTAVTQNGGPARRSAWLSTYGGEPASAARAKEESAGRSPKHGPKRAVKLLKTSN